MLNTIKMLTVEGFSLDGTAAWVLALTLVLLGHTIVFNVEAPFLKASSVWDAVLQNFSWWVILTRILIAPVIWASLNYLAHNGGLWFSMLIVTLFGRTIQILTFGVRFGQWPNVRDWLGIGLVLIAVFVTLKMPGK